ncbi:MAG TPA: hypothetical protein VIJ66_11740 [Solirubrobacteraceae bacterium]
MSAGTPPGANTPTRSSAASPSSRRAAGPLRFKRLKWISFTHSCIYTALLVCAFAIGKPQPFTFVLGLSHGLLWIFMSLACIAAARLRIVSLRLAVAVAVLGGIGPFFGSYEFIREERSHTDPEPIHPPDSKAKGTVKSM